MTECTGIPALQHRARSINNTMTTSRDVCLAHSTVIPSSWTTLYITGRSSIKETLTVFERNCVNCKWEDLILIALNIIYQGNSHVLTVFEKNGLNRKLEHLILIALNVTQKRTVKELKDDRIHRYSSASIHEHDRQVLHCTTKVNVQIRNRLLLSQTSFVLYNQGQRQIRNRLPLKPSSCELSTREYNNSTEPECGPKDSVHQRHHISGRI
ncbi:hypothetical protein J6590_090121 [Homalodisca vitripennis]|nr:hypothetical protein J6590_090121 [Homalodisca vitripennis]